MCGILAYLAFNPSAQISSQELEALNESLYHRGPDSSGIYQQGPISLAMRRLSIQDVKEGRQPMTTEDGRYTVVYNGEIYNFEQIRENLLQKGISFKTRCDTEVLLRAFADQGPACLQLFNGMFAFVIWDQVEKRLFVARDRIGIKPLYYTMSDQGVMFSSELTPIYLSKRFPIRLNVQSIADYLSYWYICEPNTIFDSVFQLPPGSYMTIYQGQANTHRYWNMLAAEPLNLSFSEAVEHLDGLLQNAVQLQMKGDVPLGTFLSGGIDSGIITNLASKYTSQPLKSFSIGFKEKSYCELEEASLSAGVCNIDFYPAQITQLTPEILQKIFSAFDEPLGNASAIPMYFLAEAARKQVTVVLTGDGADELFGGYPTYQAPYYQSFARKIPRLAMGFLMNQIKKIPVSHSRISLDYRLKQLAQGIDLPYGRAHFTWREIATSALQQELFSEDVLHHLQGYDPYSVMEGYFNKAHELSIKNQLMYVDMNTYLLNDHLRKVDRMTMAHSLEARVPYLDHRVVEFAVRLPEKYKTTLFTTKKILKQVGQKYLPKQILKGKKKGLTSPIAQWISLDLRDYIRDTLRGGLIGDFFKQNVVDSLLDHHDQKKQDYSRVIWGLLTLQEWNNNLK